MYFKKKQDITKVKIKEVAEVITVKIQNNGWKSC